MSILSLVVSTGTEEHTTNMSQSRGVHLPPSEYHMLYRNWNTYFWRYDPTRAMVSPFMRILDHTQRQTTVARTSLHEWSARRRVLYQTHNTDRHPCPRPDSNPHLAGERLQTERPLGPAAEKQNQQISTPNKSASDLCKQGVPLKSRLGHWLACLSYYLNFLGPAPEKCRNIISRRTPRAFPPILFPNYYVLTMLAFDAVVGLYYFILAVPLNKPPTINFFIFMVLYNLTLY